MAFISENIYALENELSSDYFNSVSIVDRSLQIFNGQSPDSRLYLPSAFYTSLMSHFCTNQDTQTCTSSFSHAPAATIAPDQVQQIWLYVMQFIRQNVVERWQLPHDKHIMNQHLNNSSSEHRYPANRSYNIPAWRFSLCRLLSGLVFVFDHHPSSSAAQTA